MKILSLITYPHVVPNPEKLCPIDCQVNNTVKAQNIYIYIYIYINNISGLFLFYFNNIFIFFLFHWVENEVIVTQ